MTALLVATTLVAATPAASALSCRYEHWNDRLVCSHGAHEVCIDGECIVKTPKIEVIIGG